MKLVRDSREAEAVSRSIFGLDIKGFTVEKVMVCGAAEIQKEYYAGFISNRDTKAVTLMLSKEGGVDIEELALTSPDKILKIDYLPGKGAPEAEYREALGKVFETEDLLAQADNILSRLYRLFMEKDCTLAEINPLTLTDGGRLVALDAKMSFDDNALYRQPEAAALENPEETSQDEKEARAGGLSFVSLDGEIGCIVNGAGLAMATLDIIKLAGGEPANFLDVGGSSNPQKVLTALRIITRNPKVKAVLINIFGGITRCDDIAKGILLARKEIEIAVPLVIRLTGTNQEEGRKLIEGAGLSGIDDLGEAVEKAVFLARREGGQ